MRHCSLEGHATYSQSQRGAVRVGPNKALSTYLGDHLAGATAGVELARRIVSSYARTPSEAPLRAIADAIAEDRQTLTSVQRRLGVERSAVKAAFGWFAETMSRIKLSSRITGDERLSRLLEFETLSVGIAGKLALWRALKASVTIDLSEVDLDGLIERAEQQRAEVERYRLNAAVAALGS